ncbi:BMC domain-containing protein [Paenibacillus sp. GCM10027629]|uniref:BMC domain-containing protein n=1 Tax=Paenibacillus sp. GCM10027629 TaxID=3273414 RepID=UPI0036269420
MSGKHEALGMIETWGIPALITASDAAAKAADVRVVTLEKADAGIVTIYLVGDVASVRAAVDAGQEAARKVGKLLSAHVIARPDLQVRDRIYPNPE